jgi:hypothetical protein
MVIYLVLFLQLILYYIFIFRVLIFLFYKDFANSYKKPTILLHQKVNGQQKISNMEMFFLKGNNIFNFFLFFRICSRSSIHFNLTK